MNKWDYIIKKIIIRTRHHDHHCYCHHVIMIIMMIMTRITKRECTMLREGRSRFFVRSWRGWRNSRSHPTKKHRIYTEYTQKILWRTIGNRQNRMLRIIGWTWSSSSSSSLSVIIIIDIIIVIIITIVFESVNKQNTEIYCGDGGLDTRNQPKNTECTEYTEYTECTEYTEYTECTEYTEYTECTGCVYVTTLKTPKLLFLFVFVCF